MVTPGRPEAVPPPTMHATAAVRPGSSAATGPFLFFPLLPLEGFGLQVSSA